ncbi:MAG: diguanylate cyclase [Methylococcaceae bacterium]|jgi:diguanylate cyclase (GGDEF)-like protein
MQHEFDFHELKATDRLPSPSGTALAIIKLINRNNVSAQEIAKVVKMDPALTARLLAFANSATFGLIRPVVSIQDAIMLIGMATVSKFALTLSLVGKYKEGACNGFDYTLYWSKSLLFGVTISAIMSRDRTVPPEEAFTLGILADVGRLALATAWPDLYAECAIMADPKQLAAREQELFAIDNNSLTIMLLKDWGLPPIFLDGLRQSRMPISDELQENRTLRLAKQMVLAGKICQYCLAGAARRSGLLPNLQKIASQYSFENDALLSFIDDIIKQWQEWGKSLGIDTELLEAPLDPIAQKEAELSQLNLLLVDDDPMMLARLQKQLSITGHNVSVCSDGESALKHIVEHGAHIIITDWHMQPMNGLELCKALRQTEFGKNLYIIMLTATESEESLVQAYSVGIDDYVTKPVNLRVLKARMWAGQRIIGLQQQLMEERKQLERATNQLVVSNRRLQQIANTDPLTGLANRRYTMARLEQEWEAAQRYNRPFSVLMLDLDHFKSINDNLGHAIGDQVLIHAGKIIKESSRASDVVCRIGGEEFFVIATNTDRAAAQVLAERIRSRIELRQVQDICLLKPLTISIGVAATVGSKYNWRELMKLADQALYQAKHSSRNAVIVAT